MLKGTGNNKDRLEVIGKLRNRSRLVGGDCRKRGGSWKKRVILNDQSVSVHVCAFKGVHILVHMLLYQNTTFY